MTLTIPVAIKVRFFVHLKAFNGRKGWVVCWSYFLEHTEAWVIVQNQRSFLFVYYSFRLSDVVTLNWWRTLLPISLCPQSTTHGSYRNTLFNSFPILLMVGWFSCCIFKLMSIIFNDPFKMFNSGNFSLLRVIPQVYADNKEPFHAHLKQLMR